MSRLTAHLDEVGEGYLEHLGRAAGFSLAMLLGALACLVHGVLPFLYIRTGSNCIERLHHAMVVNRRRRAAERDVRLAGGESHAPSHRHAKGAQSP